MDTAKTLFVIEYITPTGERRVWGTTFSTLAEAQRCAYELGRDRVALLDAEVHQRAVGKPRSTCDVAGSGQREVTTLARV